MPFDLFTNSSHSLTGKLGCISSPEVICTIRQMSYVICEKFELLCNLTN